METKIKSVSPTKAPWKDADVRGPELGRVALLGTHMLMKTVWSVCGGMELLLLTADE